MLQNLIDKDNSDSIPFYVGIITLAETDETVRKVRAFLNDMLICQRFCHLFRVVIDNITESKFGLEKNSSKIQYEQIDIINNFVTYLIENFNVDLQDLVFLKEGEADDIVINEEYNYLSISISDVYSILLSYIIELVEKYSFVNPNLITLGYRISLCIFSMYQGQDIINFIDISDFEKTAYEGKYITKIPLTFLIYRTSINIFSKTIFKSHLMRIYENVLNVTKVLVNSHSPLSKVFSENIFNIENCLALMNNIINIICYNYILKPEKEENERFKLKLHTISIKQIEKAQKKDETLLINKDHIIKLINKYLDMNYNFIYEHHYFKFAAAIFTYLHSLKLANDKLALRRLRYDDLEITKEEFYNEEYDIKKELKKKLLKKANGKEDEDEDPLKELSDNEEEEDGKLQSVSSRKKKIDKDTGSGIYFFSNIQKDVTFYCKKYVTSTDDVDVVEDDNEDKDINKLSKDMRKRVKTYQPLINARDNIQVIEYCNAEDEKIKINKKNEEVDEFVLKKLYFLLNPNIIKVSDEKLSQFLIEADRDSGATKIREFINFYEAFVLEVKINDKFRKTNPTLFNFLSNLNFFWINLFSFIFATGLNFVQMGLLKATDLEVRFSQTYKIIVSLAIINIVYNIFFLI